MSVFLGEKGVRNEGNGEYTKNYIRVHGELPVRWAAIEVSESINIPELAQQERGM